MAKILMVDDEKSICEEFKFLFEDEGHTVEVAHNGREGLEKVQENEATPYDLIFLDVLMPRMEGREAFEKIKQVCSTPVVIMSGFLPEHKEKEVLDLGAIACLKKPLDLAKVTEIVDSLSSSQEE